VNGSVVTWVEGASEELTAGSQQPFCSTVETELGTRRFEILKQGARKPLPQLNIAGADAAVVEAAEVPAGARE
jgi:hypothetical protein